MITNFDLWWSSMTILVISSENLKNQTKKLCMQTTFKKIIFKYGENIHQKKYWFIYGILVHKQNKYIITKTLIIKYQIPDSKPDAYATDVGSRSKW